MSELSPTLYHPNEASCFYYRAPFAFNCSSKAVVRFPFPFKSQTTSSPYRYRVNIEPHVPTLDKCAVTNRFFDIDEFYFRELQERAIALEQFPEHHHLPSELLPAAWCLQDLSFKRLAADYPQFFSYQHHDADCRWQNHLTGMGHCISDLAPVNKAESPLIVLGQQLPGDWVLLEQKQDQLYVAGGLVTGAAGWSLENTLGLDYLQWHQPVPDDHQVFARSLKYLLRLPIAKPVRRFNWGLCVQPCLDHSPENHAAWQYAWQQLDDKDIGSKVHLRVELQVLERLPVDKVIAFYIKTYFLPLKDVKQNLEWAKLLLSVLQSLPANIAEYKNVSAYIPRLLRYLASD